LRSKGEGDQFFAQVQEEAEDLAADIRRRTQELQSPSSDKIFDHVYSEEHPVMADQKQWLAGYESSFGGAA
jgi:pyruvate dehydrogenase E1 component alpha subunit